MLQDHKDKLRRERLETPHGDDASLPSKCWGKEKESGAGPRLHIMVAPDFTAPEARERGVRAYVQAAPAPDKLVAVSVGVVHALCVLW